MKRQLVIGLSIFLVIALLQACARKLDPEEPCNFVQSSELQRVSWKDSLPIKLMVHNSVPKQAYSSIENAVHHWNEQFSQQLFEIEIWDVGGAVQPSRDGYNIIYWLDKWESELMTEQARTTIYWTGSRIYEADIRINNSDEGPSFYMGSEPNTTGVDVESLMIHELGHVLGLAHNSESSSVMQVELASGEARRQLSQGDLNSVRCEYN